MQWPFTLFQDGFRGNIIWFLLIAWLLVFTKGADESREDDKTLSQQIADGKYGLIDKELFAKKPKRPGIVSYAANPEVPKDSSRTLGGLQPEEIWLAEDHVLVLKGGWFPGNTTSQNSIWPPIDAYQAPPRQVKLPKRPKVPPPFPVRLRDGGPIELLGSSGGRPLPPYPSLQFPPFPPFPPAKPSLPPPPFPLPPGAVFLPPPSNQTEPLDEDDPSIYYPPPYDFSYPKDNSSKVPAGPLVPGIVLPPPPDFFGPQEENKTFNGSISTSTSSSTTSTSTTTSTTTTTTSTTISPITSTLLPTITTQRTIPSRTRLYSPTTPGVFGSRTRPRPNYVPVTTDTRKKSNSRFNNYFTTTTTTTSTTTTSTPRPSPPPLVNIPYEEVILRNHGKVTSTTTTQPPLAPPRVSPTPPLVQVPLGNVQITNKGKSGLPNQLYYYDAPVSRPFYLEGYLLPGVLITNRTRGQQFVFELASRPSPPPPSRPVSTTRPLLVYYAPLETNTVAPSRGSTVRPPSKTFYFYEESSRSRRPPVSSPTPPPPPLIPPSSTVETIRATDVTDQYFRPDDDGGYVYQAPEQPLYYTRPRTLPPPPPPAHPIRHDYFDNYRPLSNLESPLRYRRPTTTPRTVYEYSFQARDAIPNVYSHHSLLNDASPTASNLATIRAPQQINSQNDYYKRQPLRALHVTTPPPSLATDTRVNYRHPRPAYEPEAEFIPSPRHKEGNVIRYSLPGSQQAHVYFLTPQNQRRRQETTYQEQDNDSYTTRKYHHRRKPDSEAY